VRRPDRSVSDGDRFDQRLDFEDVRDPRQVVGHNRKGLPGGYLSVSLNAGRHRVEPMLDDLATLTHGFVGDGESAWSQKGISTNLLVELSGSDARQRSCTGLVAQSAL